MRHFFIALLLLWPLTGLAQNNAVEPILKIVPIESKKNIKAWMVRDTHLPLIALRFSLLGGATLDHPDKIGTAEMLSTLLDEGAGQYSAQDFQQTMDRYGIQIGFNNGRDTFSGRLKTSTEFKDQAVTLFRTALQEPHFEAKAIERMRQALLSQLRFQESDPSVQAANYLFAGMFAGHPYAYPPEGTKTSLQKITRADVVDLKNRLFCRQRLKISIVGDIDTDGAEKLVDQLFGDLPNCTGSIQIEKARLPAKPFIKHINREGAQTSLIMAQEGISRQDKDWWAARILDFTIGGGDFSSRLMQEIRVKGGMTYGISSSLALLEAKPLWFVQAGLDPAKAALALQKIKQIWSDVAQNGLTPEEIAEAKSYLINMLPLSLTTTDQIAGILLQLQEDELPIDTLDRRANEINAVTSKHIQNIARTRLNPSTFSIVTIGPKK